jgi:cob(I)alamin adenosyltransferase
MRPLPRGRILMGHRLSKIYTRTGDDGTTGLASGERVQKCGPRIEACGAVDETNSVLGLLLSDPKVAGPLRACLTRVQHELFELGAELALPGHTIIGADEVLRLESELDALNADLPPLQEFILPGGTPQAATCHLARAVCRRAERRAWALARTDAVNPDMLRYLNRLSDLLFVAARQLARQDGAGEVLWQRSSKRPAK